MRNSPTTRNRARASGADPPRPAADVLASRPGDRIKEREKHEQEEPLRFASQDAAAICAAPAMRSRTPRVTTEARAARKAKPTASVPTTIWTIPKARNQPQFSGRPSDLRPHDGVRVLRVGNHGCITGQRVKAGELRHRGGFVGAAINGTRPWRRRNSFAALASEIATTKPRASITRLRNRKPLRNPWATLSSVAKPPKTLLGFLLEASPGQPPLVEIVGDPG